MTRITHYVASTHWDREWYEPLQGFRMRLVSMLDEVFDTIERDPAFKSFVMDGQVDERSTLRVSDEGVEVSIPPKRIATLMVDNASEE